MPLTRFILVLFLTSSSIGLTKTPEIKHELTLNKSGYLEMPGLNITVFEDSYPEGHQGGISIIQHGHRVAANGDLRLEPTPGPWSPTPKMGVHTSDLDSKTITQVLTYPDPSRNRKGFNPIDYPTLNFSYKVNVKATQNNSFVVSVDLSKPLPKEWVHKVGFNLELSPQYLLGKSYISDNQHGLFPHQAQLNNGKPIAEGNTLIIAPEEDLQRIKIHSNTNTLKLLDARSQHDDGWFVVRSTVKENTTKNAIEWIVTPNAIKNWISEPTIQLSQVGYTPKQSKKLILEMDQNDLSNQDVTIFELNSSGKEAVFKGTPRPWGKFLRYKYSTLDFSYIDKPGVYIAQYQNQTSHPFKIAKDVFNQQVWQPTLEYFLPIQMCHMRIEEQRRVWHDICHNDDARLAPDNHNHFHGYFSSVSPLTKFQSGQSITGLNKGGWHSGGNSDLNLKIQLETLWFLSAMIEEFGLDHDSSSIDPVRQKVTLHQPDGLPDAIQYIEHGLASILTAYETLGRLYHGVIAPDKKQFLQLGELSLRTDGQSTSNVHSKDDRWLFIEENTDKTLEAAATFSAAYRVLKKYNPALSKRALSAAKNLYIENHTQGSSTPAKTFALTELYLSTNKTLYLENLLEMEEKIIQQSKDTAWRVARILPKIKNIDLQRKLSKAVLESQFKLNHSLKKNPYHIPFKKSHRGISRQVLDFGIEQYFLHKAWPQHITSDGTYNAVNYVLGLHPGSNTSSFVSGVGSNSALKGVSADSINGSYIPGGIINGTGIVQPDLPELLEGVFLKQQAEYNVANASAFMFLALAAHQLSQ